MKTTSDIVRELRSKILHMPDDEKTNDFFIMEAFKECFDKLEQVYTTQITDLIKASLKRLEDNYDVPGCALLSDLLQEFNNLK